MSFAENNAEQLLKMYNEEQKSTQEIADTLNTYPNKVIRALRKLGVKIRDKSEAQKLALDRGTSVHPTQGKKRDAETKEKISDKMYDVWQNMDEDEREKRRENSRENWNNMSAEEKEAFMEAAKKGLRKSLKDGSQVENYLKDELMKAGYEVIFHKKGAIINSKLELDLFLPALKLVIEVDGPSHFYPIWGDDALQKVHKADNEKNGLLLNSGMCVVRLKTVSKNISPAYLRKCLQAVLKVVLKVEKKFPASGRRLIEIEP